MILEELIQRVQSLYSTGVQSDDSRLTSRHIYHKLKTSRSILIFRKIKENLKINQWNYQTLPCVELVEAEAHQCPCIPPVGCKILRTKHELPKPLLGLYDHLIQSVTSIEGSIIFSETTWEAKKYKSHNRYTSADPDYYIRDNYLYITVNTGIKVIAITGLFEDPLAAKNFVGFCPNDSEDDIQECKNNLQVDFPIDGDLVEPLISLAVEELIKVFNASLEDLSNNSRDNDIQKSK